MAPVRKQITNRSYSRSPQALVLALMDRGISDTRLLDAFSHVRREFFVPVEFVDRAYIDEPIIIGRDQVTTQPSLIAEMVLALKLTGKEKVLEIGTGFGFQTAILAHLCHEVFSVERFSDLALIAETNLRKAGVQNAKVVVGDGTLGLPEHSPFDSVIVSAAAPHVPQPLAQQLINKGILVQPIRRGGNDLVTSFQKINDVLVKKEEITPAYFVPLVGTFGI